MLRNPLRISCTRNALHFFVPKMLHRIFVHKKAETDISARKVIFYIVFGILASITFLFIVFLVPANASEISRIPEGMENYILIQRYLTSSSCFIYADKDTSRAYAGIIDAEKFTQANLDRCYDVQDSNAKAYRLTLNYGKDPKTIKTKNWEGFLAKAQTEKIKVYENNQMKEGTFFIEMQDAR